VHRFFVLSFFILALFLGGCASKNLLEDSNVIKQRDAHQKKYHTTKNYFNGRFEYRIQPHDRINVLAYGHPEMSTKGALVDSRGNIILPLLRSVHVAGLTQPQASHKLQHLYARYLRPLLRESMIDEDDVDLSNVELHRYRLSKMRQQSLRLGEEEGEYGLKGGESLGTSKPADKKEEQLSQIIQAINELFITDNLSDQDVINYANAVCDKVRENTIVMAQIANNSDEQAMLGDFPKAVDDAILDSSDAHENQKLQLLSDPKKSKRFAKLIFDLLKLAS